MAQLVKVCIGAGSLPTTSQMHLMPIYSLMGKTLKLLTSQNKPLSMWHALGKSVKTKSHCLYSGPDHSCE